MLQEMLVLKVISHLIRVKMNNLGNYDSLIAHLHDLKEKSERWHKNVCSAFLTEEEQAIVQKIFTPSRFVRYDGGYDDARKKKVIFLYDEKDGFSDIVCMKAKIDQRFRTIGHRDVYGAIMNLQIEKSSFGDFWIEEDAIYLYTSKQMVDFIKDHLIRINQLTVSFEKIDEHPKQVFKTKEISLVVASERADALVAALTHSSRSDAKDLIRKGYVQVNHIELEEPDKICNNGSVISIRGTGRFTFLGFSRKTRTGRIVAEFLQNI